MRTALLWRGSSTMPRIQSKSLKSIYLENTFDFYLEQCKKLENSVLATHTSLMTSLILNILPQCNIAKLVHPPPLPLQWPHPIRREMSGRKENGDAKKEGKKYALTGFLLQDVGLVLTCTCLPFDGCARLASTQSNVV